MITESEFQALNNNYIRASVHCLGESNVQFSMIRPIITSLSYYVNIHDDRVKDVSPALIREVFDFINKMVLEKKDNPDLDINEYVHLPENLAKSEQLFKGLNKDNVWSARAKKYLRFGIAATVLGILWIPALILAGIYLAPVSITAGAIGATQAITMPAWALALGVAGVFSTIGSIASIVKLNKRPSSTVARLGYMMGSNKVLAIAAFVVMVAAGVCLMPFIPLIVGGLMLKKAQQLSKTPQGLALDFANAIPGLAEKVHYGDINETALAKLNKAKQKLTLAKSCKTSSLNVMSTAFIDEAIAYYTQRVAYLKVGVKLLAGGTAKVKNIYKNKDNTVIHKENYHQYKPNKKELLKLRHCNLIAADKIGVNINRGKVPLSLFNRDYNHIQHAQKVENRIRQ